MFCPNCGKEYTDEKFCPACGQTLSLAEDFPEPPIGRYEGIDGYMDLSFYTLSIHKEILGTPVEHTISYFDVAEVVLYQASDIENGYLVIWEKQEVKFPIETELDAICVENAIVFSMEMNSRFHSAYTYLKSIITDTSGCKLNTGIVQTAKKQDFAGACCPQCGSHRCHVIPHRTFRLNDHMNACLPLKILVAGLHLYYALRKKMFLCEDCGYRWHY